MREPKFRLPDVPGRASKIGATFPASFVEFGPGNRGPGGSAVAGDIGEIERAVSHKVGMQADVQQAGLPRDMDRRDSCERPRVEPAVGKESQAAGPLGDQHAAAGQEGDAPGLLEALAKRRQTIGGLTLCRTR